MVFAEGGGVSRDRLLNYQLPLSPLSKFSVFQIDMHDRGWLSTAEYNEGAWSLSDGINQPSMQG